MGKAAIDAYFVCGGRYHDIDYARLQLLTLLAELRYHRPTTYRPVHKQEAPCTLEPFRSLSSRP